MLFRQDQGKGEEEEYVYLEAGQVQRKIEVTVTWNSAPHKKLLVTLQKSDTISYLESRVGECMEKFELFEGLTDLRAVTLFNGKQLLPRKGVLELVVKSGDHLWCDLASRDLWIDVQMDLPNASLSLFFEVRVYNQCFCSAFQQMLVDIANLYLARISYPLEFTTSDLSLERREVARVALSRKDSLGCEESCAPLQFQTGEKVENYFNFLSRAVRCRLYRSENAPSTAPQGLEVEHLGEYPIRHLRVETIKVETQPQEQELAVAIPEERCCVVS